MTKLTITSKDKTTELSISPLLLSVLILVLGILGTFALIADGLRITEQPIQAVIVVTSENNQPLARATTSDASPHYTFMKPSAIAERLSIPDIWYGLSFEHLTTPDVKMYQRQLPLYQPYHWSFSLCGADGYDTTKILNYVDVEFSINYIDLDDMVLKDVSEQCVTWMTFITLHKYTPLALRLKYTVAAPINTASIAPNGYGNIRPDGFILPSGTYTHEILVNAQ